MTTPERIRRRQLRNDWFIAFLALGLVLGWFYFDARDDARRECLSTFVEVNSETGAIRSRLVEQESQATRDLLLNGTSAKSRAEFQRTRQRYVKALQEIDRARDANPVRKFPAGVCD